MKSFVPAKIPIQTNELNASKVLSTKVSRAINISTQPVRVTSLTYDSEEVTVWKEDRSSEEHTQVPVNFLSCRRLMPEEEAK